MKKKEIKEINKLKTNQLLGSISNYGFEPSYDINELKRDICKHAIEVLETNSCENIKWFIDVKDDEIIKWKSKDHFTKIFDEEIKYCKEKYGLTRNDISFLKSLNEFLSWQLNIIVDENGTPINQKQLAELLEINPKTVYRNMKSLEEKLCIISIPNGKEIFYFVNPFLLYKGGKVNYRLPIIFSEMGYISKSASKSQKQVDI